MGQIVKPPGVCHIWCLPPHLRSQLAIVSDKLSLDFDERSSGPKVELLFPVTRRPSWMCYHFIQLHIKLDMIWSASGVCRIFGRWGGGGVSPGEGTQEIFFKDFCPQIDDFFAHADVNLWIAYLYAWNSWSKWQICVPCVADDVDAIGTLLKFNVLCNGSKII